MKYFGWKVLLCHFLRLHFWMKISWYGHFLGWHFWMKCLDAVTFWDDFLDEMSGCGHFLGLQFWMKMSWCGHFIGWNILDEWSNVEISWMSWMKCLNFDISWNDLDECLNLDMRRQFLDEIGASLLLNLICFRSVGKRPWMSGDCIGTVAVAEKGERWQAHVQRIQAPVLLLASYSSSSVLVLWSWSEMRKRGDTTDATRETRYVMPYYCCFLERWRWVSLHLLSSSSSLYRARAIQSISLKQRNDSSLAQQGSRSFQKIQSQLFCSEQFVRWKQGILEDREREESEQEQGGVMTFVLDSNYLAITAIVTVCCGSYFVLYFCSFFSVSNLECLLYNRLLCYALAIVQTTFGYMHPGASNRESINSW
jgi:hypothetical protein